MNDFILTKDAEGVATITWDVADKIRTNWKISQ